MPPETPPTQPGQYDFMNQAPAQPGNKFALNLNDTSTKHRIIIAGGGAAGLLVLFILFYVLVLAHKPATGNLLTIAQEQNQLITISSTALQNASQQSTKNLAATTSASLTSSEQQLVTYLAKHKQKITGKQLAAGLSASVTQELNTAEAASEFDSAYIQIMQSQLSQYSQTVSQALNAPASKAEAQMLKVEAYTVTLLKDQAAAISSS